MSKQGNEIERHSLKIQTDGVHFYPVVWRDGNWCLEYRSVNSWICSDTTDVFKVQNLQTGVRLDYQGVWVQGHRSTKKNEGRVMRDTSYDSIWNSTLKRAQKRYDNMDDPREDGDDSTDEWCWECENWKENCECGEVEDDH